MTNWCSDSIGRSQTRPSVHRRKLFNVSCWRHSICSCCLETVVWCKGTLSVILTSLQPVSTSTSGPFHLDLSENEAEIKSMSNLSRHHMDRGGTERMHTSDTLAMRENTDQLYYRLPVRCSDLKSLFYSVTHFTLVLWQFRPLGQTPSLQLPWKPSVILSYWFTEVLSCWKECLLQIIFFNINVKL